MKYYIHNGEEQQGPFSPEELKAKSITKDTSVWYEGLEDWKPAGEIDELKEFVQSTPPKFKQTPPPKPDRPASAAPLPSTAKPKSQKKLVITLVIISLLALIAIVVANNPNAIPGMGVKLNIPKPKVVTSRADNGKSGLFNARTTVYATVLNQGGSGNVFVTFYVTQGKKKFDHSKSIYLMADESQDLNVTFEEVTYIDGDITYSVEAVAQ